MLHFPKFRFVLNVLLADSAPTANSGITGLTVKHAGHDSLYCGDPGNCILWLHDSYFFLMKVSVVFFLFSLFLAFCWLFALSEYCFANLRCMFGLLHFMLIIYILLVIAMVLQEKLSYLALPNQFRERDKFW